MSISWASADSGVYRVAQESKMQSYARSVQCYVIVVKGTLKYSATWGYLGLKEA